MLLFAGSSVFAQKVGEIKGDIKKAGARKDQQNGWTKTGSFGLDFSSLSLINPRLGAGSNRTGFGGLLSYTDNYKNDALIWNNRANFPLAVLQDGGSGFPFTKSIDVLQFTSQAGHKISDKWYLGGMFDIQTQSLPTYGKNF